MAAEKEARVKNKQRSKECGACNEHGTELCDQANLCLCKAQFRGQWCQKCRNETEYIDHYTGLCVSCPCSLDRSDGMCHFQPEENEVLCDKCFENFGGYRCNRCAAAYHWENNTCVPGPPLLDSMTSFSTSPQQLIIILSSSIVGVLILSFVIIILLYRSQRGARRRRRGLVSEDKLLLTNESFDETLFSISNNEEEDSEGYSYDEEMLMGANGGAAAIQMSRLHRVGSQQNGRTNTSTRENDSDNASRPLKRDSSSFYILTMEEKSTLGEPL